ncbi:MAG: ACP S-malonyltransferase [Planctomycetes bacterium]|nr:ACP S-malonyltransferase [Planctomycetota bacterium]
MSDRDTRPIAVLLCPGRGSYGKNELGCIGRLLAADPVRNAALRDALAEADAIRARDGRPTLSELDAAPAFRPGVHLDGKNAAELIYFATMAQLGILHERYRIVAVLGNSLGWYTALAAAGAVDPAAGALLVRTMARLQDLAKGGQILTTAVDAAWRSDPVSVAAIDAALHDVAARGPDHFVARSIRLGGHEVLAGTETGVSALLAALPKVSGGEREFPFRLAGHGPFHTSLCTDVAATAQHELAELPVTMPGVHLIDGKGDVHSPWSADPDELLDYTTGEQVLCTFDFSAAVRTALREFNPDVLLCAGPGTSLRAPAGHIVIREGYRGIEDREALFASGLVRVD